METNIRLHEILGILQAVQAPDVSNSPQSPSDELSTLDQREDNTTAYPTPTIFLGHKRLEQGGEIQGNRCREMEVRRRSHS